MFVLSWPLPDLGGVQNVLEHRSGLCHSERYGTADLRLYESGKNRRQAPFRQSQGTNRLFDSYAGQTQAYAYAELMSALKTCALATAWPRGLYILMHPTPPRQEI